MTNLVLMQPTVKIDPTNGLIAYVQAVKPYHTKIMEVLVEYIVEDDLKVTFLENMQMDINLSDGGGDVIYTCGYGFVWNPYSQVPPSELPTANVIGIESDPINTFIVQAAPPTPYPVVVRSTKANQLTYVAVRLIVDVIPTSNQWIVAGSPGAINAPGTIAVGDLIYVSSNGPTANGQYTVVAVEPGDLPNQTKVTTRESISLLALPSGNINVPLGVELSPQWPAGSEISFTTTGTLPEPLQANTRYYYVPSKKMGVFNVSEDRYPTEYSQLIDLTTVGFGNMRMTRAVPFVPGETINIAGTTDNDGQYTINTITDLGNNQFKITVLQRVVSDQTTPDGTMTYAGSFGDPYCGLAHAPPLHAETIMYEKLVFDFGPHPDDPSYDPPPYEPEFV